MELVNIVMTGDIRHEVELSQIYKDIDLPSVEYSPENFPGLIIRDVSDSTTILLFTSGKFNITGASNQNEINNAIKKLRRKLNKIGIIDEETDLRTKIVNVVYSAEVELNISLEKLLLTLGFENIEYEPEISPFLIYRPDYQSCVVTVSNSGKIVITGVTSKNTAQSVLSKLKRDIKLADK